MSRLTRTPFHKPSPFDIPRPVRPLSPPETEVTGDSVQLPPMNFVSRDSSSYADMGASSSFTRVDTPEAYQPSAPDTQTGNRQFRRPSNLSYLHSGTFRTDSRAPRSVTKWLVMVVPPPVVSRENGSGVFLNASARSSHGVLLPLLPSLSGQLSAIAREFSFPSTTGICIYLQMAEGGVQFAPRISDESWSILWGSAFDERQTMNTMGGLPIAGRIEFDLDLRKARWFDMWLTSQRHSIDLGLSAPVSVTAHHREESRTTTTFEHGDDSAADDISVTIQRKRPAVRHIPRKLSLLDRIDVSTLKPNVRPASRLALSPTDAEQPHFILSPVAHTPDTGAVNVEDEEPETAKQSVVNVQKKVQNWRASSSFPKSPALVSTGQTALDPVNMPNNQPLVEPSAGVAADGLEPLNLDDFTWSISSAGPLSADFYVPSPHSEDGGRPPSVHLDTRLEGSVCLTPTTCTSFGPPEYDIVSPVGSFISRLPSPDIAERQFEDSPPTPSTATSWGAPLEWPDSPASVFRAPSVDIAARQFESRPVTPSTATSWGAPLDWPNSPAPSSRAPSVDLAERHLGSRPVTPSTATSWGAPMEWPPSPATPFYVHTPGVGNMFFDDGHEESALLDRGRALRSSPPDDKKPRWSLDEDADETLSSKPWQFVWPYRQVLTDNSPALITVRLRSTYPRISLYPAVYPYFDLYPASCAAGGDRPPQKHVPHVCTEVLAPRNGVLWKFVWPYQKGIEEDLHPTTTRLAPGYPSIDLYPAVYPHFDLYPAKPPKSGSSREVNVELEARYPTLCIYPATYPNFEIYPGHVIKAQKDPHEALSVHLKPVYPSIEPYPAVYPFFDLYPASSVKVHGPGRQPPRRPISQSHPGLAVSRKAAPWKHVWPYQHIVEDVIRPATTRLEFVYPSFGLYPAVYPHFELYPAKSLAVGTTREISVKLEARYPIFGIYSAVYPSFEIYPGHVVETQKNPSELFSVKLCPSYPSIEIYALVYPHLVIYPDNVTEEKRTKNISLKVQDGTRKTLKRSSNMKQQIKVTLEPVYPHLEIYPPVYPHVRVYPSLPSPSLDQTVSNIFEARYPILDIYPAVYPFFDIYRSEKASTPEYWREELPVVLDTKYPTIDIYPVVYPSFDIYRTGYVSDVELLASRLSTRLEAVYPAFDIYPAVYPHFALYPSIQFVKQSVPFVRRACKTHQQLVDLVLAHPTQSASRVSTVPRIYISLHDTRSRPRRTHKELVERVFPKSREVPSRVRSSMISTDVPRDVNNSSNSPRSARLSSIPTRPSEFRRSNSLGHATMSSSFKSSPSTGGVARSGSLRQLPPLREGASASNVDLQQPSHLPERRHAKRDSIVLERARHWGAPVVTSGPKPTPLAKETSPETDLSEFPMPPLPPISKVLGARPLSTVNRPVAKLDRTKFPFR